MAQKGYQVLARKWRPQRFEDVVGQEHITRTLKNAISSGRIHHAFLFIGSRGIGKTTSARILAKALNCLATEAPTAEPCGLCSNCTSIAAGNNMDVIEIDGASNNSVDDVRELRDNIRMVPTNARYKVYIIDEVHQLSIAAFNALLKTLEEPPPHAVFVLATTESHKIPATIISRCQRYDFRRVAIPQIMELLQSILEKEGRTASPEALHAIARAAEGGVRDAESILDELITYCGDAIAYKDVFDVLGLVDWSVMHDLVDAMQRQDIIRQLQIVEDVVSAGKDLTQFVQELLRYFRNLLVCKAAHDASLLHLPEEELAGLRQRADQFALTHLIRLVEQFAELIGAFDSQLAQRIALESLLIRISKVSVDISLDAILEKLVQLGAGGLTLGAAPMAPAASAAPAAATPRVAPPPAAKRPAKADPKQAGPIAIAAEPVPAQSPRIALTEDNMRPVWDDLVTDLGRDKMNHGIWFHHARPIALTEESLTLEVARANEQAWTYVCKPENRAEMEAWFQQHVSNSIALNFVRTEGAPAAESPAATAAAPATLGQRHYGTVSPEAAARAMQDPGVQTVLDVFKGTIAEVIGGASAESDE
ncbi:MAG: DNA polymerase III subunit gamma/tau [Candidatus Hydrogenedentes bacterium]|nr:DNA polymerase III subunit gamma/tau [Candidatus Hydrogenedentota bacterium]